LRDDRPLEVVRMRLHTNVSITDPSLVGEARRIALNAAGGLGFDETARGRVALVVTELANNLAQHARDGRVLIAARDEADDAHIEILSLDHGPGMADVSRCLQDGFSTRGTPGTGLGAVQRLANTFSIFSVPERGTVIVARVHATETAVSSRASAFTVGSIALPAPNESVSGDTWLLRESGQSATLMLVDALGHGPEAAVVAAEAVRAFERQEDGLPPSQRIERLHDDLRGSRGAAVTIATLDIGAGTIVFAGAGNVSGRIISGVGDRSLLSQHGTVGAQIRRVHDVVYPWPDHALLLLHSDGLTTRWNLKDAPGLLQYEPAVIAGWLARNHLRGPDDATVVVVRRSQGPAT
jgi:anti-sigma regulatory factor (Ser/Thr protein kinase)